MVALFQRAIVATLLIFLFAAPASALDRRVQIINNTDYAMVQFYGSYRDTDSWQEDILGSDVMPSGTSWNVNFNDGTGYCIFDFKAVFSNGEELTDFGINVCEIERFTYN